MVDSEQLLEAVQNTHSSDGTSQGMNLRLKSTQDSKAFQNGLNEFFTGQFLTLVKIRGREGATWLLFLLFTGLLVFLESQLRGRGTVLASFNAR